MYKKIIGILAIIIGILALVTPFTPGSWLIFVGLGLLGIRILFWEKLKNRFSGNKESAGKETGAGQQ